MTDKILNLLSISAKAGKVKSGSFAAEEAIKNKSALLAIMAEDASDGTKKQFTNMTTFYEVQLITYSTKETLGRAIGKDERSIVCTTDESLTKAILEQFSVRGGSK